MAAAGSSIQVPGQLPPSPLSGGPAMAACGLPCRQASLGSMSMSVTEYRAVSLWSHFRR